MAIEIRPVDPGELDEVMPLVRAYQDFYEVTGISEEQTREFFGQFAGARDDGWLYAAWVGGVPVGFACYYRVHNSLVAADTLLFHDLYVKPEYRGSGIGRRMIENGVELGRTFGASQVEWSTAPDNLTAQRLYDSTGAEKSTWLTYELKLGD